MMQRVWDGFVAHVLAHEGSTRAVALLRILLVFLVWTRFADQLQPFRSMEPERWLVGASFYLSTTLLLIGYQTRVAALWTAATLVSFNYWFGLVRGVEEWTHHHTWLLAITAVFVATTPCGRSYSVDRWLAVRRAEQAGEPIPDERGPLWGTRLLALQTSYVYLMSAYDKTFWGFLNGDRLQHSLVYLYGSSDPVEWVGFEALCMVSAVSVVALEYVLPFGLWFRRYQPVLIPMGLVLHVMFYLILPVATFSGTMAALYLMYIDPEVVHRVIDRLHGQVQPTEGGA
jgi:hypothetical protein